MPVKRNKQTNETLTKPLTPLASDIKQAIESSSNQTNIDVNLTEHVFRTNINCRHDDNIINRYWFTYPGTIRTITNQQLLIGIRAVYYKIAFDIILSFDAVFHKIEKDEKGEATDVTQTFSYKQGFKSNSTTLAHDFCISVASWIMNEVQPKTKSYFWFLYEDKDNKKTITIYISDIDITDSWFELNNLSFDFKKMFCIDVDNIVLKTMKTEPYNISWNIENNELEVTASFVNQTESQHLGYTGITFIPMKYYKINSSDTEFYIELWSNDGLRPIQLLDDKRDNVVIEAVMTTRALK